MWLDPGSWAKYGVGVGTCQKVNAEGWQRRKPSGARSCAKVNDEIENDPRSRRKIWERKKSKHIRLLQSVLEKLAQEKSCKPKDTRVTFAAEDQSALNGSTKGCKRLRELHKKDASKS